MDSQPAIIDANPIENSLSHLRDAFRSACEDAGAPFTHNAMDKLDQLGKLPASYAQPTFSHRVSNVGVFSYSASDHHALCNTPNPDNCYPSGLD